LSERKTVPWTIRIDPERVTVTNSALAQIIEDEGFEKFKRAAKRHAFDYLIDRSILGFSDLVTPIRIDRLRGRIECDLLIERDDIFYCLESMGSKKKEPVQLGADPDWVFSKCKGCQDAKQRARQEYEDKQAQKDSIKKVLEFRKLFMKIAKDGFFANVRLCTANVSINGGFFISTDGITLPCLLQEGGAVNINKVCKMVLDTKTGQTPCRYLVEQEHIVRPDVQREAANLALDGLEFHKDGTLNLEPEPGELGEEIDVDKVITS